MPTRCISQTDDLCPVLNQSLHNAFQDWNHVEPYYQWPTHTSDRLTYFVFIWLILLWGCTSTSYKEMFDYWLFIFSYCHGPIVVGMATCSYKLHGYSSQIFSFLTDLHHPYAYVKPNIMNRSFSCCLLENRNTHWHTRVPWYMSK